MRKSLRIGGHYLSRTSFKGMFDAARCYTSGCIRKASTSHMTALLYLLVFCHVVISLFLIGVVLLQTGKSADLAGAFGGQGSQTAFGPRGAANLLTKLTSYAAILFMFTAIGLTVVLSRTSGSDHSVLSGTGTTKSAPASPKK